MFILWIITTVLKVALAFVAGLLAAFFWPLIKP